MITQQGGFGGLEYWGRLRPVGGRVLERPRNLIVEAHLLLLRLRVSAGHKLERRPRIQANLTLKVGEGWRGPTGRAAEPSHWERRPGAAHRWTSPRWSSHETLSERRARWSKWSGTPEAGVSPRAGCPQEWWEWGGVGRAAMFLQITKAKENMEWRVLEAHSQLQSIDDSSIAKNICVVKK
jgi:hypothetical protein